MFKIQQRTTLPIILLIQIFFVTLMLLSISETVADNSTQERENVFTNIYSSKAWGVNSSGEGFSGAGSTAESTELYRQFLQVFIAVNNIHSVVDVGCGDWEFSRLLKWDNIDYKGYDIVKNVIEKNRGKYAMPNIQFFHADAVNAEFPSADLLICKDVLMHLSNEEIQDFIKQLEKYHYCLITDDITLNSSIVNTPKIHGSHRVDLDLTQPPFLLNGAKVYTWNSGHSIKQTFLLINER